MPSPTEDTKLGLLCQHYEATFSHILSYRRFRDWLFVLILGNIVVMLFQLHAPAESEATISQFLLKTLGTQNPIDGSISNSIIWFSLLALTVRYYQTNIQIERQYDYIHMLEEDLAPHFSRRGFTREGAAYLSNYPWFLKWATFLYNKLFPFLLILVSVSKIGGEIRLSSFSQTTLWVDTIICIVITLSTVLYMAMIHGKK